MIDKWCIWMQPVRMQLFYCCWLLLFFSFPFIYIVIHRWIVNDAELFLLWWLILLRQLYVAKENNEIWISMIDPKKKRKKKEKFIENQFNLTLLLKFTIRILVHITVYDFILFTFFGSQDNKNHFYEKHDRVIMFHES